MITDIEIIADDNTVLPMYSSGITSFDSGSGVITLNNIDVNFQNQNSWTVEIWICLEAIIDQMNIISCQNEFQLMTQGNGLYAAIQNQNIPLAVSGVLEEHTWYHIAVTSNGATTMLYLNGGLLISATAPQGIAPTGNPINIGGSFYGQLDSCRFWNICVSSQNIYTNQWNDYTSGTDGLLAQMDFTQIIPVDTSGNNVTTTFSQNGVKYNLYIPATSFEGNGFADTYNDSLVNPGGTETDFSVLAWVNPQYLETEMVIFSNGSENSNSGMYLFVNSAGNVGFQVGNSTLLLSNTLLNTDCWSHVAATWTAAPSEGTIYINGVQDNSSTTMTFTTTMQAGYPIIAAIASEQSALPISSFQGYIQTISIWSGALTASEISIYMTDDPQSIEGCIADYNLMEFPVQNNITLNPLGLVDQATMFIQTQNSGTNQSKRSRQTAIYKPDFEYFSQEPANLKGNEVSNAYKSFYTLSGTLLQNKKISIEVANRLNKTFEANLILGVADTKNVTYPNFHDFILIIGENGINKVVCETAEGSEVIYEGLIDECTFWLIKLVAAIGSSLFLALGIQFNTAKWLQGYTTFLGTRINSIGLNVQLLAIFNNGVSPSSIYKALFLFREYSLLFPLVRLSWSLLKSSIDTWSCISIGVRIALLFTPAALFETAEVAWFVARLAYSINSIQQLIDNKPANCFTS